MSRIGPYRLESRRVGRVISFRFDERELQGVESDTVASALLANGIRTVSRSFKFHRPRGLFSAGFEEPNGLVQLHSGARAIPSARATLVPLRPGLEVFSQSGWPSVSTDLLRAIDFVHPLFAAGFYNKTFIWPNWRSYEPIIRKLAGLGHAPKAPDPDRYDTHHAHCDVLVVGGGSAGLEAATRFGASGKRVWLVDLSNEAFPHLGMRVTRLVGGPARIYRVSFSGELTYEINVPSHRGAELWSALLEEGRAFGIEPYGVDALLHLRMEKGFLHVGADTDGSTVPEDIGFGKPAAAKQRHYIGKRSLSLPENVRADRLQLVGLAGEGTAQLAVGSHLRLAGSREATDGWVTSAGPRSADGRPIAMAMLRAGRSQMNKGVTVHNDGRVVTTAKVVTPMFYDPTGARMHG